MKLRKPIPKKRRKPRRVRPDLFYRPGRKGHRFLDRRSHITKSGRVRLFGRDYEMLRMAAYDRSAGTGYVPKCECGCGQPAWQAAPINARGELSHDEHGARKSDELHRVKWMRHECHMKSHNCGGKPVPPKERVNASTT